MAGELIGREALDRILKRAAELQAGEQDVGDGLTRAELLKLGDDVGIPAQYLRQALLEEQTRAAPEPAGGLWGAIAGPARVSAYRVVPGDPLQLRPPPLLCRKTIEHVLQVPNRLRPGRARQLAQVHRLGVGPDLFRRHFGVLSDEVPRDSDGPDREQCEKTKDQRPPALI